MKNKVIIMLAGLFLITACIDLDMNPLSEASSENWYSDADEIAMSVNDLFKLAFWPLDAEEWTDDNTVRTNTYPITSATINSEWGTANTVWSNSYKAIVRANTILSSIERAKESIPEVTFNKFAGNALFVRASQYSKLISHFGDVVFFTGILDLDESFTLSRTDKTIVLEAIYKDFDEAVSKLPLSYSSSENQLATKGAALAMKARIALYMGDWSTARDAAKACMDLENYELFPDFETLFLSKTKNPKELIFGIPRSRTLNVVFGNRGYLPRNHGGWGGSETSPSWDLFCSFLCSDGLPIDESPLFNPREPFKNRDPRCSATLIEFGTPFLGIVYQPHPDSLKVMDYKSGKKITNNDTRTNAQWAVFNGILRKKQIDESWLDNFQADNDIMIMRYADVLLIYAEAKIEMNEIDQSVLDAINMVRARAYKVNFEDTSAYPAVSTISQSELRTILRVERRMEFAWEGLRYMDIIRWKVAETVLNRDNYGMLDTDVINERLIEPGLWFFGSTPEIDENGNPDFSSIYDAGLCRRLSQRKFDASKQYLWPIPASEILINPNMDQNPGY